MQALETIAKIDGHRLVLQDKALPERVERARVIVMWESTKSAGRRIPPSALAGMGVEKGNILNGPPENDWDALS
jgi:hypothetical protein